MQVDHAFVTRERCPSCAWTDTASEYSQPFCEPPVANLLKQHYRIDPNVLGEAVYALMRCRRCSLVYQRWVANDDLLAVIYGVWIADHSNPDTDAQYQQAIRHPLASRDGHEIVVASSFLRKPLSELTTLDYGMGWGLWARISQLLGCETYGLDLSVPCLAYARRHGVNIVSEDQIGKSRYDFINTEQVFEHLVDPRGAAQRLAAALAPGGILKISVPSADRVGELIAALKDHRIDGNRDELMPVQPLEHVNSFTRRSLNILAGDLGLKIVIPPLARRYAFLHRAGSVPLLDPRRMLKELVRPVYQWRNPHNLYVWLQKPAGGWANVEAPDREHVSA